jgi:hypothetical protein
LDFEAGFINGPRQINILEHDYLPRSLIAFDSSFRRAESIPVTHPAASMSETLSIRKTIFRAMA